MRCSSSAYALHMSWSSNAYALKVCQKRDFSRDRGSPTRGSVRYCCISMYCRRSSSLSILATSVFILCCLQRCRAHPLHMSWRCSAYALHMSWSCSAYALELQRICVAYELELQLICVEVCQKRDFSRDIGSPTRGSASYYCISKCCRSSGSLSILTASIFKFLFFSGLFCAPV